MTIMNGTLGGSGTKMKKKV